MYDFAEIYEHIGIATSTHNQLADVYHTHIYGNKRSIELVYVVDHEIIHYLDGKKYHLKKGDYVFIDVFSKHAYETINNKYCRIFNCLFTLESIDKTLHTENGFQELYKSTVFNIHPNMLTHSPTQYVFHDDDESIKFMLEKMVYETNHQNYQFEKILQYNLRLILIESIRKLIDKNKLNNAVGTLTSCIISEISKNYYRNITLDEISDKLHYSRQYLSTIFKKDTGVSFAQFLQKYRIEQSIPYLSNTNMKIVDIAFSVGYNDVKHFNSLFKKYIHTTPSMFRKTQSHINTSK